MNGFENTRQNEIAETTARVMARHSLENGEKIDFKAEFLTLLIRLYDELQEWGTEIAVFLKVMISISSVTLGRSNVHDRDRFF
jgi:hypothetical protein